MGHFQKRLCCLLVLLCIIVAILPIPVDAQPTTYSTQSNSGTRHEICTSLDGTGAGSYYTGTYTYDSLSQLSSSSLLQSLRSLMTSTHKKSTSYNDCKNEADRTDCQNGDSTVVLLYTSYAAKHSAFSGSSPGWNREHVWPKSLGGFETSGPGSDLHHIRPSDVTTNSKRGNKLYGNVTNGTPVKATITGANNALGGYSSGNYFEPLDNVKGDVARICLYVYVRYGGSYSRCNNIANVFQSIDVLLQWCALDPVDTWEMGRNVVVGSIQGNRNVFIDYPELAWLLFGRAIPSNMVTPSGKAGGNSSVTTTPTEPTIPTIPTEPTVPTIPTEPTVPTIPTEPTVPTVPTTPTTPSVPTVPTTPTTPTVPTTPTTPVCRHETQELQGAFSASCSKTGYTGDTYCRDCGALMFAGSTIPKTGHTDNNKDQVCDICKVSLACTHASTQILHSFAPTCTTNGYTGDTCCTVCNLILSGGTAIPAAGHTDKDHNLSCDICFVSIDCVHNHTERSGALEADCGTDGYSGDTHCIDCGVLLVEGSVIPATKMHTFTPWTLIVEATSSVNGLLQRTCTQCGAKESQYIPMTPGDSGFTSNEYNIIAACGLLVLGTAVVAVVIRKKQS